jgi:hypothetical protein
MGRKKPYCFSKRPSYSVRKRWYVRKYRKARGAAFFVYLELPNDKRRRNLKKILGHLGAGGVDPEIRNSALRSFLDRL